MTNQLVIVATGVERMAAAIHMLHEQAHGDVPYVTCQQVPCCQLRLNLRGPAPRVLPGWSE